MASELFAVIMAGGSGTRFWPASRAARPKQFLPIASTTDGSTGRSMIAETYARIAPLVPAERVLVVTARSQAALVREALPELPEENVLCEPCARNTGACVAWAASEIARRAPDSVQVVLPADHVIEPADRFRATIAAAAQEAREADVLLTLGVHPSSPHTGYGYIQAVELLHERDGFPVRAVKRFVEKPDDARAKEFLDEGGFYWNAGIFVWRTDVLLAAIERHAGFLHEGLLRLARNEPLEEVYARFRSVPIDKAVMERADNVRMLPVDYRWSDVGSWAALPEVHAADASGNVTLANDGARVVAIDAEDCVTYVEGERVVALVGVQNLVVVQTANATLVCPRDRAQDVRKVVEELERDAPEYL